MRETVPKVPLLNKKGKPVKNFKVPLHEFPDIVMNETDKNWDTIANFTNEQLGYMEEYVCNNTNVAYREQESYEMIGTEPYSL